MGRYNKIITILQRGGGPLGPPKRDYVICARPVGRISLDIYHFSIKRISDLVVITIKGTNSEIFFLCFWYQAQLEGILKQQLLAGRK